MKHGSCNHLQAAYMRVDYKALNKPNISKKQPGNMAMVPSPEIEKGSGISLTLVINGLAARFFVAT